MSSESGCSDSDSSSCDEEPEVPRGRNKKPINTLTKFDSGLRGVDKRIAHYIDEKRLAKIKEYQTQLRQELRTKEGILKHLNRIIRKRRRRREQEEKILQTMRGLTLSNQEKKLFYSYILNDEIEWFDMFRVPNDACILEVGRRNAGKTFGTNWTLYTKRKVFPFVYVMTMTKYNGAWAKHVHPDCIFQGWTDEAVTQLRKRQAKALESPEWGIDPRAAVVLDDMAADKNLRWNPKLLEFSFYGRHLVMFVIVTSQWYKQLAPGFRENCDILFIYKMDNEVEIEALWKEHSAGIPRSIFHSLVQKYSTDTTALVIVKNGPTPLTKFYQYRALNPGPFRLGCKSVWKEDEEGNEQDVGDPKGMFG